jgi:hypothetical protein
LLPSVQSLSSSPLLSKNIKIRIYKIIILPVVLYRCETWSVPLREEHRLRVFDSRVLKNICGAKRDEVSEGWRKLHNEGLRNLFASPNMISMMKSRRMKWAGHVALKGVKRTVYWILVAKPEG